MSAKRQQAVEFFTKQGWSAEQASGLVANLESESGLRPDAVGDGGKAYGIAQWHPPRQAGFEALLGKPIQGSSLEEQLYWVHAELRSTEKGAGEALAECRTAAEAGACVSLRYERPADQEGEARKRAALAETIFQVYGGTHLPNAPVPPLPTQQPKVATPVRATTQPEPAMPIVPLLLTLLPQIFNGFSPAGQAQVKPMLGQPVEQLAPLLLNLFSMFAQKTGVLPADQSITTEAQAVATVAEFNKLKETNAALVTEIEQSTLNRLKIVGPMLDKLVEAQAVEKAASVAGMNSASERALKDKWDMTKYLVVFAGSTSAILVLALLGAIIYQATQGDRKIDVALIGLAGPLFAIAMGVWREIFAYRFDGSPSSSASNAIAQQIAIENRRV